MEPGSYENIRNYDDSTDRAAVVNLWSTVFGYDAPHNRPELIIGLKVQVDDGLFVIAERNDRIIGTVIGGYDGHRGWIYSLAVLPGDRQRGVATMLMREIEYRLQRRGCIKINLQVVASNESVVRMYEKLGYSVEERISMGKRLIGSHIERVVAGEVPLLMAWNGDRDEARGRGTVFFLHGFTACKETHLKELESLASRGFLAIGIDARDHGERRHPRFDELFDRDSESFQEYFVDSIDATAGDIPRLIDDLAGLGIVDPDRLGLAGISMGGHTAYRALVLDDRFRAAVIIAGSPRWELDRPGSPHHHLDSFYPVALYSITAGADDIVPPGNARELHRVLESRYASKPERLRYLELPGEGHFFSPDGWERLWNETLSWLEKYI
jgi:ribosomal protein S18 acetylase RimI-like enzyme/dienelactone hydrolase